VRQRFEGNEAHPVAVGGRAGVGPGAVAGAAERDAAGGVPRDVAVGVGVDEVLRRAGEEAQPFPELLPALRPVHQEEGGQVGRVVERRPPQRVEASPHGDERTVPGDPHPMLDRAPRRGEHPGADADRLVAGGHRLPAVPDAVPVRVGRVELLDVEVRAVVVDVGRSPRHAAVAAEDHARHARHRHPGDVEVGRAEVHRRPDRRHAQREVRVVGEQRLARRGAGAGDHPVVAARGVFPRGGRPCRGRRAVAADEDAVIGERRRKKQVLYVGWKPVSHHRAKRLALPAGGEVEGEELAGGEGVDGRPRTRRIAQQPELHRQRLPVGLDERGHPLRVRLDERSQVRRHARQRRASRGTQAEVAHLLVGAERAFAERLGQLPQRAPPQQVHLPQAVLGGHVALGARGVEEARRLDVGHAHRVAADDRTGGEPGKPELAIHLGQGLPRPDRVEPGRSRPEHGEGDHGEDRGAAQPADQGRPGGHQRRLPPRLASRRWSEAPSVRASGERPVRVSSGASGIRDGSRRPMPWRASTRA